MVTPAIEEAEPVSPEAEKIRKIEDELTAKVRRAVGFKGRVIWQRNSPGVMLQDVVVEHDGDDLVAHVSGVPIPQEPMQQTIIRAPSVLSYSHLAGADASGISYTLSDGQRCTYAQCAFSSCIPGMHLVPDFFFFRDRGYRQLRAWQTENDVPWSDRTEEFIWRGRRNSVGLFSVDPAQRDNPVVAQRLRMAMHAKDTCVDFRFVGGDSPIEHRMLQEAGFIGDRVEKETWVNRKFAIDIDGFSNAWDNLFHGLLLGCCILKVESQVGFRQWYYDRLNPWEHYVPVSRDISDLQERVDWCLSNQKECEAIAAAGQALARELSWEAVLAETTEGLRKLAAGSA